MHNSGHEKRRSVPEQWKGSEMGQMFRGAYRRTGGSWMWDKNVDEGEHTGFMYQEYSSRCGITLERAKSGCDIWKYKALCLFGYLCV